jgi:putative transferase (TIGR04331 family)
MKNEGSKLIILQHGGTYGLARKFVNQDHEFKIADIFLSWGWSTEINCKVIPGSMMIMNNHVARKIYDQPHILWVIGGELRYSYKLWSQTIGAQWDKYINEQIDFYSSLTRKLQKATLVRLYNGSGWNEKERFLAVFPDISITESKEKLRDLSTKSRVVVLTYNATTFLETLSLNIPTIIYWDTGQWELSDEGIPYFDELKSVGIFHETPVSAAAKIEDVWDDIEKWWMQDELQTVVRKFVHNYARTSDNDIDDFMKKIQVTIEDLQFIQ